MNFSKTTSYSLSILAFMAQNSEVKMSAGFLHKKLCIPYSYLRQVLSDLSKSGFITGSVGRSGGFVLSKKTDQVFLADILSATEGLESFERCLMGFTTCPFSNPCAMHTVWADARTNILNTLKSTSLSDLMNKTIAKL